MNVKQIELLRTMAQDALKAYGDELARGGEPPHPEWASVLLSLLDALYGPSNKIEAIGAGGDGLPVPYPNPEDVTPAMRAGFERLYQKKQSQYHKTLERNEQGTYANLPVAADWIFYQRAWADAITAQPTSDAKDAARYRWFMYNYAIGEGYGAIDKSLRSGEADKTLSAAIDAAREREVE